MKKPPLQIVPFNSERLAEWGIRGVSFYKRARGEGSREKGGRQTYLPISHGGISR